MRLPSVSKLIGVSLAIGLPSTATAQDAELAAKVEAIARVNSATSPSLSPDGRQLAYLSNASGSPQVWVRDLASGLSRQLTDLSDPVQNVSWSPKGDWIAYAVAPGGGLNVQIWVMKSDGIGARRLTAGGKENNGLTGWTDDGTFIRADTNVNFPSGRDAVLIDPTTGRMTTVVGGKGLNFILDLQGEHAVVRRLIGRGDSNAYLVDRKTGAETLLTDHQGQAEVDWGEFSPDGRQIYTLANVGRDRHAFGTITLGADGAPSPILYFAERDDAVAEGGVLSDDGSTAALMWNVAGKSELAFLDTRSGRVRPGPKLPVDIAFAEEFSADGRTLVLVGASADRTTDIYLVEIASGRVTRATESKHDGIDLASLVRPELIEYPSHDGLKLSGWLYRPRGASGPMPVVFNYHGGPEGQARPGLSPDTQALVASGIGVFAPNVRGSSGFGKAFMAMDDGAKRVDGVKDIEATTQALVSRGIADPNRLGIMGGSYGGYMVMAGITQYPDMFAAAADLFGVVNFETFFKQTEPWMAAISTTEYGDPATQAEMLKSLSPIHKLDHIKSPLMVLHGANDTNVPVIEAEQIVSSLKRRGVTVEYVLFPDEGHGWRKLPNRVRSTVSIVNFFDRHLNEGRHK